MGIYDSGMSLDFGPEAGQKVLYIVAALLAIAVIAGMGFYASEALSPQALQMRFEKNPVQAGERTTVIVKVTNTDKVDAVHVPVSLGAKDRTEFDTYALNEKFSGTISLISVNDSREITFVVNPVGNVLPGTYTFVAKATINGKEHVKEAVLTVNEK